MYLNMNAIGRLFKVHNRWIERTINIFLNSKPALKMYVSLAGQRRVTYLGNVDVCDLVLMPDISLLPPSLPQSDWLSVWSSLDMWRLQTDCQMPEILIKCGAEFKISSRWHYQQFWSGLTLICSEMSDIFLHLPGGADCWDNILSLFPHWLVSIEVF